MDMEGDKTRIYRSQKWNYALVNVSKSCLWSMAKDYTEGWSLCNVSLKASSCNSSA